MYEYKAKIDKVVDGDTVDFIVELGFFVKIKIRGRFKDVDTPERGHPEWQSAAHLCAELLDKNKDGDGYVIIKTEKTGKYGRWIVEITGVTDELAKKYPYRR